ncbi:MAG: DUF58 domain-containing protein [Treponema sp.]|nr:DUF58 domain-containing protein [Treponema sp.]
MQEEGNKPGQALFSFFRSFPLTLPGLGLLSLSLIIFIRSLSARNVYEIVLSLGALIFILLLGSMGAWAIRRFGHIEPLLQPPVPLSAGPGKEWQVHCPAFTLGLRVPWFYRVHFLIRGRFYPQGAGLGSLVFNQCTLPRYSPAADFSLSFPLGGLYASETRCRLRDIFGLFSFSFGQGVKQTLPVHSSPGETRPLRIRTISGAEDQRTKSSSDVERYYQREYVPGDLLRDINWKSSGRIDSLITRISPDNQERVTRIDVHFRSFGPARPSLSELWLLDRAKARLAWFLRTVKEEAASYVFHVQLPTETRELHDLEEIDAFLEELAPIPFYPAQQEEGPLSQGEIYVFSTACDLNLQAFLLSHQGKPLSLFLAQHGSGTEENLPQKLRLRDFPAQGLVPLSYRYLVHHRRQLKLHSSRMLIDYGDLGL